MTAYTPRELVGPGQGLRFTESPRWRGDRLWFIDIHGNAIKSVGLGGDLRTEIELPFKPNGLGFLPDGSVVFSDALNLSMKRWQDGVSHDHADLSATCVFCLSDAIADAQGRTWVSDIGYNFWNPDAAPAETCVIARIDPDGRVTKVAGNLRFPNGVVITPDGSTLIIAETNGFCLTAYDIGADGSLSNQRVWADLPEGVQPDGICLDPEGAVWVANPGEAGSKVLRVREGGEVTATVELETHAYAVAVAGAKGEKLVICASDSHDPAAIAANPTAHLLIVDL
ncbi:MAG: SMP-30/gluconolactonase/LRE family protein [Novosphingobium sp.]